ncbi:flagellar assembly protein FliH [Gallaecimonas xiamenensis]|uniref:Flagellar assembly protein FliH n=1 Tax=Gallaecimonas xiamenensis 3-C-1 TaxID=745411 RepID=K2JJC9_9GAMM|nr:flagellar assembly protein FliH [Gallaecimonas xiamenensis]EKE75418.1 flagellar assembly protein H [Gallaecimonas xiamenensis 3-C-1]
MVKEYQRWEGSDFTPPEADEVALALHIHRRKQNPEAESEPEPKLPQGISIGELEALRSDAVEEGLAEGRQQGLAEGREQGLAQGIEEGRAQGYQQGLEEGLKAGQQQIQEAVAHWLGLADELTAPLEDKDGRIEARLVMLLTAGMQAVLGHEIKTDKDSIHHLIRQGIDALSEDETLITIEVAPTDARLLREHYSEAELKERRWKLREEPTLKHGQCRIESGQSLVELDLQERLRVLCQGLLLEAGLSDDAG